MLWHSQLRWCISEIITQVWNTKAAASCHLCISRKSCRWKMFQLPASHIHFCIEQDKQYFLSTAVWFGTSNFETQGFCPSKTSKLANSCVRSSRTSFFKLLRSIQKLFRLFYHCRLYYQYSILNFFFFTFH